MLSPTLFGVILPLSIALAAMTVIGFIMYRQGRHRRALRILHIEADALERDLKECRVRLERAHAAMSIGPNRTAAGESDARSAIDAALRELLAHRLWLRDRAGDANQHELDAAVAAIGKARAALGGQLQALDSAQRALDTAVRERIEDLAQR
jgi:hypothetical protein